MKLKDFKKIKIILSLNLGCSLDSIRVVIYCPPDLNYSRGKKNYIIEADCLYFREKLDFYHISDLFKDNTELEDITLSILKNSSAEVYTCAE